MQVATTSSSSSSSSSTVKAEVGSTAVAAVDSFGHKTWKTTSSFKVGVWDPTTKQMQVVSIDTKDMGQRCHELDTNGFVIKKEEDSSKLQLRPIDRDGKRRPYQPGELPLVSHKHDDGKEKDDGEVVIPTATSSSSLWYVPFCVMPNMNGHAALFDQWETLVLKLVNNHKLPGTSPITDLSQAHTVLPNAGTKAFGMDLHLQVQRWLADRLTSEWDGNTAGEDDSWLQLYTETIRQIVQPFMAKHYASNKFYVQKHPKNLRLQMPGMKSVQHWHCDHMFAHPRGEINFSLCLTEFKETAGICLELLLPNGDRKVFPILAGAGSIVVAPFGYCPHGNFVNSEAPKHTRVSIDWRIITLEDMEAAQAKSDEEALGSSATSGLLYAPGAYYGLWDSSLNNWVDGPKKKKSQKNTTGDDDSSKNNLPAASE